MTFKHLSDWDKEGIKNILNEFVSPEHLNDCNEEIIGYISEIKRPRNLIYARLCYRYNVEPSRAGKAVERLYMLAPFNE
jgi:hypothetical protein